MHTRVGLTTRWPAKQQGHLSVGNSLLGEIIKDDQSMHAMIPEVLSHGTARVGCQVLQRGSIRGSCRDHNAV